MTTSGQDLIASAREALAIGEGKAGLAESAAGGSPSRSADTRFVAFSTIDGLPWEAAASAAALLERVRSLAALGLGLIRCTEILDCGPEAVEVLARGELLGEARRRFATVFRGEDAGPGLPSVSLPNP